MVETIKYKMRIFLKKDQRIYKFKISNNQLYHTIEIAHLVIKLKFGIQGYQILIQPQLNTKKIKTECHLLFILTQARCLIEDLGLVKILISKYT